MVCLFFPSFPIGHIFFHILYIYIYIQLVYCWSDSRIRVPSSYVFPFFCCASVYSSFDSFCVYFFPLFSAWYFLLVLIGSTHESRQDINRWTQCAIYCPIPPDPLCPELISWRFVYDLLLLFFIFFTFILLFTFLFFSFFLKFKRNWEL